MRNGGLYALHAQKKHTQIKILIANPSIEYEFETSSDKLMADCPCAEKTPTLEMCDTCPYKKTCVLYPPTPDKNEDVIW